MVYLHEIVLPGETSGGKHLCVCLSHTEYAKEYGLAVLASLRKVQASWWRPLVDRDDFTPNAACEALDQARAVDTSQMVSVPVTALTSVAGRVSVRVVADTMKVLPALFQFRGPWEVRGAVHQIRGWPEGTAAVLVLNDDALDNPTVGTSLRCRMSRATGARHLFSSMQLISGKRCVYSAMQSRFC